MAVSKIPLISLLSMDISFPSFIQFGGTTKAEELLSEQISVKDQGDINWEANYNCFTLFNVHKSSTQLHI